MAWYALAYTRVHELYHLQGFLRVAKEIFHWCWNKGWDHSSDCGGIWFDQSHQGKSTIENTQMYALGMKLARFSNSPQEKQDFQGKSQKVWNFLTNKTGILNGTTFQVFSKLYDLMNFSPEKGGPRGTYVEVFSPDQNCWSLAKLSTMPARLCWVFLGQLRAGEANIGLFLFRRGHSANGVSSPGHPIALWPSSRLKY